MEHLPILDIIEDIKNTLKQHNVLIIQAPPGAGKSTLIPLELLKEDWLKEKKILMLEPRRLAAKSVANRMSSLLNEETGNTIGYRIRFENKTSSNTKIEVVTEGILTRMLQQDNTLEGVGLVIFDEFHERSLHSDLALALCREVQQILREDLKIIVMSATLDDEKISALLDNAPVLKSNGRQYPVEIKYLSPDKEQAFHIQVSKAIKKVFTLHEGDILVFLPGTGEINRVQELIEGEFTNAIIHPLYGDLPYTKQQEAIIPDKYTRRKIILTTSIAETSLTIEGIKIVIDSGLSRVPKFDPKTGLTKLETIKVTKDAADQRAGRAGRLGPGHCYRLWTESTHQYLASHRTPEISEADLAPLVLELSNWGIKEINTLTWLTPPPPGAMAQAKDLLNELEALNENIITERGKEMASLPTHPRIAHLLIEGKKNNLISLATDIAALLEEKDPLSRDAGANISLRINALRNWRSKKHSNTNRNLFERIDKVAAVWRKIFKVNEDNEPIRQEDAGKLLTFAYPDRIAKQREQKNLYKLANGKTAKLHEHDPLIIEEWLAIAHMDAGTTEGKIFIAAPLNLDDVLHLAKEKDVITWDFQNETLIARKESRIGNIIISTSPLKNISEEEKTKALCEAVKSEGIKIFDWNDEVKELQARVLSIRKWRPEENWPDLTEENLLKTVVDWLSPFISQVRKKEDFRKLDLKMILTTLIPWELQQKMEILAPDKIKVPSGSEIRLKYNTDGSFPVLAVRLQEMFGVLDTPTVNEGKIKVLLHLLSPGYKPVQVTQDLRSFWQNTYPEVRKELRIRYSKHHWPEDPWTAEAVRGVKKKNF